MPSGAFSEKLFDSGAATLAQLDDLEDARDFSPKTSSSDENVSGSQDTASDFPYLPVALLSLLGLFCIVSFGVALYRFHISGKNEAYEKDQLPSLNSEPSTNQPVFIADGVISKSSDEKPMQNLLQTEEPKLAPGEMPQKPTRRLTVCLEDVNLN